LSTIHNLTQGTEPWHQFRLQHFGASEAAAMLGLSTKVKRTELLHMKCTGMAKEFSDWVQENILDYGHEVEAMALPHIEKIIGEELFAVTVSDGMLSASLDGLTIGEDIAAEHKQWNEGLAALVAGGTVPDDHMPQCQQTLMLTGAKRLLFVVSDGTPGKMVTTWVKPSPEWFARIRAGWAQFADDMQTYKPAPAVVVPVAATIEALPALMVRVEGKVVSSNLEPFRAAAVAFLSQINTELTTDQHFADAAKTVKFCQEVEDRLALVKEQALSQTASIDELFRAIDSISAEARSKRLMLDKLVTKRKSDIRADIAMEHQKLLDEHIATLNTRLGKPWIGRLMGSFGEAMKGLKTVESVRDAAATLLANLKIELNARADVLARNRKSLIDADGVDSWFLFADFAAIGIKPAEDFDAIASARITKHNADEAERKRVAQEKANSDKVAAAARAAAAAAPTAPAAPVPPAPLPAAPLSASMRAPAQLLPPSTTEQATMKLGDVCDRIGVQMTAKFMRGTLLIHERNQAGAGFMLYPSDFQRICVALKKHIDRVQAQDEDKIPF
jgi:predicted phage-related endonuclease